MTTIKIAGIEYPTLDIQGKVQDREWGNRFSKAITLEMSYADAVSLFHDGLEWSICEDEQEWDNSEYSMAGDIIDHRDGTLIVKMGKPTELETAITALSEAEAALTEGVESIG